MIELLQFQREASTQIADRFIEYHANPEIKGTKKHQKDVPFFQALGALTGAGKTVVLADAVSQIASSLASAPVVLWLSKGKAVVEQSYANLAPGGKYHHLLGPSNVKQLSEYDANEVEHTSVPVILFATVGTFNQKDMQDGTLTIYRSDLDTTEQSVWDALSERTDATGARRPLIVVYDEAQNLSDQQTDILLSQEPNAFMVASATMVLPAKLDAEVQRLRQSGRTDEWLATTVRSSEVVSSGLVKNTLSLAGYKSPMEETVSAMLADMALAEADAANYGIEITPKAIYVCKTNMHSDDAFRRDDPRQPFDQRQAPPILIWRYLTEQCKVDPAEIAVYANLDTHRDYPLPAEFVLFSKGDNDFVEFTSRTFRHIIFNLTLQEGWDDPETYFAYIDKSMESTVQITQVIGRVLRQPGATHFAPERLNTAHFYVRVDKNETFSDVLSEVAKRLGADAPDIRILAGKPDAGKAREFPVKNQQFIPRTALVAKDAQAPIESLLDDMIDYSDSSSNAVSVGSRRIVEQKVGSTEAADDDWHDFEQSNRVSARWVFHREVLRLYAKALNVASTADHRFDVKIGMGSRAYKQIVDLANKVVQAYVDNVTLVQRKPNPYEVGPLMARDVDVEVFQNALHEGYDRLNPSLELPFARALDASGATWCRNPPRSGYGIPLVSIGDTENFYPDFILWAGDAVICIDTKGPHLLQGDAVRKLLAVEPRYDASNRLLIRFVSPGTYNDDMQRTSPDGFTVWGLKSDGKRRPQRFESLDLAVTHLIGLSSR